MNFQNISKFHQVEVLQEQLENILQITSPTRPYMTQMEGIRLLKSSNFYQPGLSFNLERSKNFSEQQNFLISKLTHIHKKFNEPYNLGYRSVNQPSLDLSQIYQIPFYRISINPHFYESKDVSQFKPSNNKSLTEVFSLIPDSDFEKILSV